ncbi:hypothetical protein [Calidithermus terrae]|nr:hypothetical protein [Calidithermus terrae]
MPECRRPHTKGGLYFFTAVTYQRQRILVDAPLSRPHLPHPG